MISGYLLESEISENGQDAVERRFINQSIAPEPGRGLRVSRRRLQPADYIGAGQAFIDNGVYNIGVRPIAEDIGRGGHDAFGWPLSLATMMLKNLGGSTSSPAPHGRLRPESSAPTAGMFEETAQDQQHQPRRRRRSREDPQLPPWMAPFANEINVGRRRARPRRAQRRIQHAHERRHARGLPGHHRPDQSHGVKNESYNSAERSSRGRGPTSTACCATARSRRRSCATSS